MDYRMILIERSGYDRVVAYDSDKTNAIRISSPTDDIFFNRVEGKKLYEFLKGVYEEDGNVSEQD